MFSFSNSDTPDHRAEKAYFNLRWTLWLNRPELTNVFDAVSTFNDKLTDLVTRSYDANASWTTVGDLNMSPAGSHAAALQAADDSRGAYAGLIFVVLRTITKKFKEEFQPNASAWQNLPRLASGFTIFQIVRAASDNFRHYDDWRTTNPLRDDQKADIRILAAVRGPGMQQIPEHNWNLAFGTNMCVHILYRLGSTYAEVERLIHSAADELLMASNIAASPGITAARSL